MQEIKKSYQTIFEKIGKKDDSTKSIFLQYMGTFLRRLYTKKGYQAVFEKSIF